MKNNKVGDKLYVFVIDLNGDFHFLTGTIKTYKSGSLCTVDKWDNENLGKNLRIPKKFYPQASYSLFPHRKIESMICDVRMFGFELEKLKKEWTKYWLKYADTCSNLSVKFSYFADLPLNEE